MLPWVALLEAHGGDAEGFLHSDALSGSVTQEQMLERLWPSYQAKMEKEGLSAAAIASDIHFGILKNALFFNLSTTYYFFDS